MSDKDKYFGFVLALLLTACQNTQEVTASQLFTFTETNEIHIQDRWDGLALEAPLLTYYFLRQQDNQFAGKANFMVGGYEGADMRQVFEDISVPAKVIEEFLELLSTAPLEEGEYEPDITYTDSYPSIRIKLVSDTDDIAFFTQSQGVRGIPWGVEHDGKIYVINSVILAKALDIVNPYFKRETRYKLIQEVRNDQTEQ